MWPKVLSALILAFVAFYALWILYLAVMNLSRVKNMGKLTPLTTALGTPVLFTGYILDALVNWILMTVILLELPKEITVTSRLQRHNQSTGWRKKVAQWFEPLLDPFDPSGDHI